MIDAVELKTFPCINCPCGCVLEVSLDAQGNVVEVEGNTCARGLEYARNEATHPVRMVTAALCVAGSLEPVSVKTQRPVPKAKISEVLAEIAHLQLAVPIAAGDCLIDDVAHTGVSVIATKSVVR